MKKGKARFFSMIGLFVMLLANSLGIVPLSAPHSAEAAEVKPAEQIHYTITGPDSVTFDWVYGPDTIQFGEKANTYDQSVKAGDPIVKPRTPVDGLFREAKITGLKPGTTYHYTIDDGKDYTFHTAPKAGSSGFSVVTTGDVGASIRFSNAKFVNELIASLNPDLYLGLGDFTYGDQEGQESVNAHFNDVMVWSRETPYMPNWGNHEWQSAFDDLTNYKGRFDLPNPQIDKGMSSNTPTQGIPGDWYWFDYGNTRFIAYPEPFGNSSWSSWASEAAVIMEEAEADDNITFVVTFGHRPTYSSGYHGSNPELADLMEGLAKKYPKFALNLIAHDHHYERTHPEKTFGVLHVVAGTGGSTLSIDKETDCKFKNCTPPPWSAERFYHFGAVKLDFKDDEIVGTFVCGPSHKDESIECGSGASGDTFTIKSRILKPDLDAVMDGSGTVEDPYMVMTAQDLYNIRKNPAAQYKLGANLDLTFFDSGDGKGWLPIDQTGSNRFSGGFDGNGFIINGLTIKRPDSDHSALFGYTGNEATIKNVALENVYIEGKNYTGALVSYMSGSGSIKTSYATGTVKGARYVGGLGGQISRPVSDSFARVNVTGNNDVGGLIGLYSGSATNTYSTGKVTGSANVGGLIGNDTNGVGVVTDSYWDIDASGQTVSAGGIGKTTAQMKQEATYANWDFNFIWQIDEGEDYPLLSGSVPPASSNANLNDIQINGDTIRGFSPGTHMYNIDVPYSVSEAHLDAIPMEEKSTVEITGDHVLKAGEINTFVITVTAGDKVTTQTYTININREAALMAGSGTETDPYQINTAEELNKMRLDKTAHYILLEDIDLSNFSEEDGKGWMPIGVDKSRFIGNFDGKGHVINGLRIERSDTDFASLFGYVTWGGSIKNIGLTNVDVKGKNYVGGLAGYMDGDGEIRNASVTGTINGSGKNIGGLVGDTRVSIYDSYVHADVTGNNVAGGFVGRMQSSSSSIDLQINRSYFTGTVKIITATNPASGGFIAELAAGKVINSYWNTDTAGQTPKVCGSGLTINDCGIGKTTAELKQKATYVGWDFANIWEIDENNGFPLFKQTKQLSSNADLSDLKVGEETVSGFDANQFKYTVDVPNETTSVKVTFTAADADATVVVSGGNNLEVGSNIVTVTVTAADGITENIYMITVNRAAAPAAPDVDTLLQILASYESSGDIKQPLISQLRNTAEQAQHHSEKGHMKQAEKSLDDFLKKINNKTKQDDISPEAKLSLTDYVQSLKELWSSGS
ncbi:cadherin-like beta sandwich domain-containing protein [Lederbergia citrea]|uniref:cadherin-like beta sandwich domain-containing protein n=1 Tax=Lederbergia citrea TaxID=2833581 RepID=UPI001BC9AABC|nr:cadherin-like beta sandwich domain-containing protein [Lederbergia citrea]MBS4205454.1 cadherin-like beta sandwich domain-containing protein [Lederbergia citrea]